MPSDKHASPPARRSRVPVVRFVVAGGLVALMGGAVLLIEQAPRVQAPAAVPVPAVPVVAHPQTAAPTASATAPASPSSGAGPSASGVAPTPQASPSPSDVLPTPEPPAEPTASTAPEPGPTADAIADLVDTAWVRATSRATQIPERALRAYAAADLTLDREVPGCYFGWNTVAAIGSIESHHGSFGGSVLGADGVARPSIIGIALNGAGVAAIPDTDDGRLDGDPTWDRAVGPLQFIPSTWRRWAADGNGDGRADPQQIDDAALTAARYLCAMNPLDTADGWRRAVLGYNNSDAYVTTVAKTANRYAESVLGE